MGICWHFSSLVQRLVAEPHRDKQPFTPTSHLPNLTCMYLNCGRKPENPVRTYRPTVKCYDLLKPTTFLSSGCSTYRYLSSPSKMIFLQYHRLFTFLLLLRCFLRVLCISASDWQDSLHDKAATGVCRTAPQSNTNTAIV